MEQSKRSAVILFVDVEQIIPVKIFVRDGLGAKLGLSGWTGNDVNDEVKQAKVESSGLNTFRSCSTST